jgi:hypothetical protein
MPHCKPVHRGQVIGVCDRADQHERRHDMSVYEHPLRVVRQNPARRGTRVTVSRRLLVAIQRWQRKRALAALQALPDFYLESIGTARADLPEIANNLFPAEGCTVPVRSTGATGLASQDEFRNAA